MILGILNRMMRGIVHDPSPELLELRRKMDHDKTDEVWEGVLHMVPFPTLEHCRFEGRLERALRPIVEPMGFETFRHGLALYDPQTTDYSNYRGPDVIVVDPKYVSMRGVEGRAELVVEVLSPNDESRDKLADYARWGVQEAWLLDPATRAIEVFTLRDGIVRQVDAVAPRFGIELRVVDGPKLQLTWSGGSVEI